MIDVALDDVDLDEALQLLEAVVAAVDALLDAGIEECRAAFCEGRYYASCRLPAGHDPAAGHQAHPPASRVRDAISTSVRATVALLEQLHVAVIDLVDLDVDDELARALVRDLTAATRATRRAAALSSSSLRATPPRPSRIGRRVLREAC